MASYFPHLSLTGPAPTANQIHTAYRHAFLKQISEDVRRPQVIPCNYLSLLLPIVYLCIPQKQNPVIFAARWPLVGLITWFELRAIQQTSGTTLSLGFMNGMQSSVVILWIWTWLIIKRPQRDAKRVERRRVRVIRDEMKAQLTKNFILKEEPCPEKLASEIVPISNEECYKDAYEYFWQSYPENIYERIFWVLDLLMNYRGPGWNWSVPIVRTITPETLSKLENPEEGGNSSDSLAPRKWSKSGCCENFRQISIFVFSYLIIDIGWHLMMQDPYFKFGPNTYELPSHLKSLHPIILYLYRMSITGIMLITSMRTINAAFNFIVAYILGPRVFGLRGEPIYYNQVWGSFSNVFDRGLGGLWGNYWHQTFRNFFTAPTDYLIENGYIKPRKFTTKLIGLAFAFVLSGFIHWAGMVTAFGDTKPLDEFLFYGLQGIGVGLQSGLSKMFSSIIVKLPVSVRKIGNLLFTLIWFYLTAWLEADNLGRSGLYLLPVIPFSPLAYFGFGEQDAKWDCWSLISPMWYTGKNLKDSGIFFV
ncbi:hypothetical protein OnM2_085033 [Erysiphe neolycopersici]|uniref:Wax synthase domain-containing protein n=1 Tax=Erysiphe neolycopersici TaxID=212602 RepID=A0A420HEV6_9PEZI|nr:hypothetical protein OnM2_085033 [Erysiphe neolycopersici]